MFVFLKEEEEDINGHHNYSFFLILCKAFTRYDDQDSYKVEKNEDNVKMYHNGYLKVNCFH